MDRLFVRGAPRDHAMWVPLDPDPQLAVIRAHEMAHAKWTPPHARRPRVVPEVVVNAVEDARVNYLAVRAGVDFSAGVPSTIQHAALTMAGGDWRRIAVLLVSALDSDDFASLFDLASHTSIASAHLGYAARLARTARRMLGTRLPRAAGAPWSYNRTLYVARWLSEQLGRDPEPESVPEGAAPWGHMTIETPQIDRPVLSRVACAPEGVHLRAPWRLTTDHAVFRAMRAPRHGAVLLDASGSMGLDPRAIAALARTVPAGVVAAYGGHGNGHTGVLRILARRGRIAGAGTVYDFSEYWQNQIDGPALRWLAAQDTPRVWVSDGGVSGVGDTPHPDCDRDITEIVHRARIAQVRTIDDAIVRLRRTA